MATKYIRAYPNKLEGVYFYESKTKTFNGKPDRCYVFSFKVAGRKIWEKVGWKSKGITPQIADQARTKRIQEIQLGAPIVTATQRKEEIVKRNRTINEIAIMYFEMKGNSLKGFKTDLNRYEKRVKPLFSKLRVSEITTLHINELLLSMPDKAEATKWNTLEILRRIINFGVKAKVILPFLVALFSRAYAACFNFMAGVIPPMPMFGLSLL